MGYDVARFPCAVDEELLCPICSGVLEAPMAAPKCEHAFCKERHHISKILYKLQECINRWLERQPTCPVDRQPIQQGQLQQVPRILRNLLARLEMNCENSHHGCEAVVKLDLLSSHLNNCQYNPKRPVDCEKGCGLTIPKDEINAHNCIKELAALIRSQEQKLTEQQQEIADCKYQLAEQRREIALLKDRGTGLRRTMGLGGRSLAQAAGTSTLSSTSAAISASLASGMSNRGNATSSEGNAAVREASRTVTDQIQDDQVIQWAESLPRARVTRWGGMISTPDTMLQSMIQRALVDSGCPEHIVSELMANAHERRWPPGLLTLETRQMNRRQYEQYVCRRIQNKQAVVVMACDNTHMSDDMILEPGLVMIFAHGIE